MQGETPYDKTTRLTEWFTSLGFDYLTLGGNQIGLLAKITGPGIIYKWDKQGPNMAMGASLRYAGQDISNFTVEFRFWHDAHMEEWRKWLKFFRTNTTRDKNGLLIKTNPFTCTHPVLDELNIGECVVGTVKGKEQQQGTWYTASVDFEQYAPPKPFKVSVTPDGELKDKDKVATGASSKAEQMVAQLSDQAGSLVLGR